MQTVVGIIPAWLQVAIAIGILGQLVWRSFKGPQRVFARFALSALAAGILLTVCVATPEGVMSNIAAVSILVAALATLAMYVTELAWLSRRK